MFFFQTCWWSTIAVICDMKIVKAACTWKTLVTNSSLFCFELRQGILLLNGKCTWTFLPRFSVLFLSHWRRPSSFSPPFTLGHENQAHASEENTLDWLHNLLGPMLLSYSTEFALTFEMIILLQFFSMVWLHPLLISCLLDPPPPLPILFPPPIPCGLVQQSAYSTTITNLKVQGILF